MIRSRWHVPVQILGTALAVVGYFLGHGHKGRQFAVGAHHKYAPILHLILAVQVFLGIYLKLHLERGYQGRIRPFFVMAHGIIGKTLPLAAWVQFIFGGIASLGFCREDHLGQCLAHFIMGSAFIAYGIILTIILLVGQAWLARRGKSQEFFDSIVIAAWGCVNTFTEHRWGGPWVHNDLQHTSMGVIWWCAGLLGLWLSVGRNGEPKRNIVPSLTIGITGWAMSSHPQSLMISTMTHSIFGYTLMAASLIRIIEISFVLKDQQTLSMDGTSPSSFQFLPPFVSHGDTNFTTSLTTYSCSLQVVSSSWVLPRNKWVFSMPTTLIMFRTSSFSTASLSSCISVSSPVSSYHSPANQNQSQMFLSLFTREQPCPSPRKTLKAKTVISSMDMDDLIKMPRSSNSKDLHRKMRQSWLKRRDC
jgi:hypothetical protein